MAKGKASREAKAPAVAGAPSGAPGGPPKRAEPPVWRDFILVLLLLLGVAGTVFVILETPLQKTSAWWLFGVPLPQAPGFTLINVLWIVTLMGALGRLLARRTVRQLQAAMAHNEIVRARLEPGVTEDTGMRMRHVSAWLVGALGASATAVVWHTDAIDRILGGYGLSTLVVGVTISAMFALAVAANTINRLKARRLIRDFHASFASQRLALGTLGALDAMISACLPNGERTRFNDRFLSFVGKTAEQMQGLGWLEVVHPDDRQSALDLVSKPLSTRKRTREHDICVRSRDGEYVWLHEKLAPRCDEKGNLIEFIGIAVNITTHIENEASLDKLIGTLKVELEQTKTELVENKSELSKTKTARTRLEKGLDELRVEAKNLQTALERTEGVLAKTESDAAARISQIDAEAEARVEKARADAECRVTRVQAESEDRVTAAEEATEARVAKTDESAKLVRQELTQTTAENKKLTRAFEKLQEEIGQVRQENGDLREQIARHIKETREAKTDATQAHANESQHRSKNDRLTQRCAELEAQLAAKEKALGAAQDLAQEAGTAAAAEVERRLHEVSAEALATQLRKQLEGVQRMTSELLSTALDGPAHNAAHNAAASVRAMSELVEQAISGGNTPKPMARSAAAKSFDIRRTVDGVRELLAESASAKGVQLAAEIAPNVPALVHGDDLEIRTAIMSLTDAALHLVQEGKLIIRVSEDVNTSAHSTLRIQLNHASARIKADLLEEAIALKSTDKSMPDAAKQPVAHQAARAWQVIRKLQGQHGFLLPDQGGFSVWFTFTLGRPAAAVSLRGPLGAALAKAPQTAQAPIAHDHQPNGSTSQAPSAPSEAGDSRQMPRMPQELLNCNLGEVAELGGDSMRVFAPKPPKHKIVTIVFDEVDIKMDLRGEILWCKKLSGRRYDVGVKFVDLTPEGHKKMLRVAMQHRKVSTMLDAEAR